MKQLKAVNRSLVTLKKQIRGAVKELNQQAAALVARGKYDASSSLMETARKVGAFVGEVEALRERWTTLRRGPSGRADGERTPLWEYYALVAKALVDLGGEANRSQVADWINRSALDQLKAGDVERSAQGRPIWQKNLSRARRAMIKEGYLEPDSKSKWKLTRLGRDIAKHPPIKA